VLFLMVSDHRSWVRVGVLSLAILCCGIAYFLYAHRGTLVRLFHTETRADLAGLGAALDSAYATIEPKNIVTTTVTSGGLEVRYDRVELARNRSLLRANLEITRAVERAGGRVVFGVQSDDERNRWQAVTLGISDGDSLVRQIKLEKRLR
jgi:hypothetical protein